MKVIKFAILGCGKRGAMISKSILVNLPGIEIIAVSDPYIDKAEQVAADMEEMTGKRPTVYGDYTELLEAETPDAVFVATAWEAHIPAAVCAMKKGVAVAMEVGAVYNEEECWDLINTYEETKTPFMLMENCCFGKEELLATAMARAGKFGEIVYCHGAYMHDLRKEVSYGEINRHYRNGEYTSRNRDNYPTHDLGPIAKLIGINRGNRMVSLSSRASKACGLRDYIKEREELAYLSDRKFAQGDVIETIITCENGELINLKLDTTLPTYYSREFTVRGTKGLYEQKLNMALFDGEEMDEGGRVEYLQKETNNAVKYYNEFLPEMWKKITPEMIAAGHGGMDIFEFEAFCDCLRTGKEMPIDVYDAAAWMCISYLTGESIANDGASVEIPDFTKGAYKNRKIEDVIKL